MDDEGIISFDDAATIGFKIVEMADRVKIGNKHTPGAQARWAFEVDDDRFDVVVSLAPKAPDTGEGE